jgi:16S rRNA C967 or C1407 C5-methylase (RsmB/RsmF family)
MDLYESKAIKDKSQKRRSLISNTALSTLQSNQKLHQKADRVLIDAPCSG